MTVDHLYCTAIKDNLIVQGVTTRYRRKHSTCVFYAVMPNARPPQAAAQQAGPGGDAGSRAAGAKPSSAAAEGQSQPTMASTRPEARAGPGGQDSHSAAAGGAAAASSSTSSTAATAASPGGGSSSEPPTPSRVDLEGARTFATAQLERATQQVHRKHVEMAR